MAKIKQSETVVVRRSQIRMNPVNPKRHTEINVDRQRRNIGRVGFLGGIVWNEASGNLVDGHRRLMAMDVINHYDGTDSTDYEIKVEKVEMDEKTEKEQLTYMSVGDTRPDLDLVAKYAGGIDLDNVGFSPTEIHELERFMSDNPPAVEMLFDTDWNPVAEDNGGNAHPRSEDVGVKESDAHIPANYPPPPAMIAADSKRMDPAVQRKSEITTQPNPEYQRRKEEMLDGKRRNRENYERRAGELEAYVTLSFSSYDCYAEFCRLAGGEPGDKYIKGEPVLTIMERRIKEL